MQGLHEVVYRVRLRDERRAPSLARMLLPEARVASETIATNLDGRGNVWRLVQVRGRASELEAIAAAFATRVSGIRERRVLARGPRHLLLWYKYGAAGPGRASLTARALRALGPEAIVTDRTAGDELEVRVLAPPGPRLKAFLRRLPAWAAERHEFRLLYVGALRDPADAGLSPDEDEAVAAAQRLGFLEVPHRASLRELGRALGCSASAAGYRLRRAVAKLAKAHVGA